MKSDARRYALWLLAAAGLHAALLFGPWKFLSQDAAYSTSPDEGVEVSLVDSAPGPPAEAAPAPVPAPAPAVAAVEPPPTPTPLVPDPTPPPSLTPEPTPEPPKPVEKPEETKEPKEPKATPRPERKPKATPARSNPSTANSHAAASNTAPNAASGTTAGAVPAKGAGGAAGAGSSKPAYLLNPHPPYPPESKANHEQGLVTLAVAIDEAGEVTSVSLSQSSGFPRLDQAAREGVSHWRFRPARVAGFAVASHLVVPVRFRLSD